MIFRKPKGARTDKLKCVGTEHWETPVVGTEYLSPKQHGGFFGTVYRQYFTTSLPSDLTSGDNVAALLDYMIRAHNDTNRHTVRGLYSGTILCISHSGTSGNGNLTLTLGAPMTTVINGWVEYTK